MVKINAKNNKTPQADHHSLITTRRSKTITNKEVINTQKNTYSERAKKELVRKIGKTRKSRQSGYKNIMETNKMNSKYDSVCDNDKTSIENFGNNSPNYSKTNVRSYKLVKSEECERKRKLRKLISSNKNFIKPTNKKLKKSASLTISLNQILGNSNGKDSLYQSDISTKYSKSEYSRFSGNDLCSNFKKTHIDMMNKIEHNLFENLKQGHTFLKPSKKKEISKPVIVEHSNKVISFIKEVSQGQEVIDYDQYKEHNIDDNKEYLELVNKFKASIQQLKEIILETFELIDRYLYVKTRPSCKYLHFAEKIKQTIPSFCDEYVNLIMTADEDLYQIYNIENMQCMTAKNTTGLSHEVIQRYAEQRKVLFNKKLNNYLDNFEEASIKQFKCLLNEKILTLENLFSKSVMFIHQKVENKVETKQEKNDYVEESCDSHEIITKPSVVKNESTPLISKKPTITNTKRNILDFKSQIVQYVS